MKLISRLLTPVQAQCFRRVQVPHHGAPGRLEQEINHPCQVELAASPKGYAASFGP
jgi:hypothetical protein